MLILLPRQLHGRACDVPRVPSGLLRAAQARCQLRTRHVHRYALPAIWLRDSSHDACILHVIRGHFALGCVMLTQFSSTAVPAWQEWVGGGVLLAGYLTASLHIPVYFSRFSGVKVTIPFCFALR